jgi:hypothetical protein
MAAEMKPDCYGGKTCDKIVPRWWSYANGDMQDDYDYAPLNLDARLFPPGTKISISEPVCPDCGETRSPEYPPPDKDQPLYAGQCDCGFDWDQWVLDQYS